MPEELEWKTRKERVDRNLKALHPPWEIVKHQPNLIVTSLDRHAVEEYPTESGPADYALFVEGKFLGIIEAKKVTVGPPNVLEQAKRYARGAVDGSGNWNGYRVPFLYSTNGEVIHFVDVRSEKIISRRISRFHTADALEEMFSRVSRGFEWFRHHPVQIERLRPLPEAGHRVGGDGHQPGKRAMLVAMATGTGKTFMTVAQIYRFLESKAIQRVLFLVDRRALAAQAVREFAAFNTPKGLKFDQEYEVFSQRFRREDFDDDKPFDPKVLPDSYLTVAPVNAHLCLRLHHPAHGHQPVRAGRTLRPESAAIPITRTRMPTNSTFPSTPSTSIIADECHRGYTASDTAIWRDVLDYFDAVKIGLTATPAPHTLSLFMR